MIEESGCGAEHPDSITVELISLDLQQKKSLIILVKLIYYLAIAFYRKNSYIN